MFLQIFLNVYILHVFKRLITADSNNKNVYYCLFMSVDVLFAMIDLFLYLNEKDAFASLMQVKQYAGLCGSKHNTYLLHLPTCFEPLNEYSWTLHDPQKKPHDPFGNHDPQFGNPWSRRLMLKSPVITVRLLLTVLCDSRSSLMVLNSLTLVC